jgi:hypothetical protein
VQMARKLNPDVVLMDIGNPAPFVGFQGDHPVDVRR